MPDSQPIHINGVAAGTLTADRNIYRFRSVARAFDLLDGAAFANPAAAERAAKLVAPCVNLIRAARRRDIH